MIVGNDANGSLTLQTNNTDRVTVTSGGSVGIGTTSPRSLLSFGGVADASGTNGINLFDNGGNYRSGIGGNGSYLRLYCPSDGALQLGRLSVADGSTFLEAARIDSSGRLLVGTSSSITSAVTFTPAIQAAGASALAAISVGRYSNDSSGPTLILQKSRNTTVGSQTIIADGDGIGRVDFEGSDGVVFRRGASIEAFIDGSPSAGDLPTRLVFSVTRDGQSSPSEAMRISNSGQTDVYATTATVLGLRTNLTAGTSAMMIGYNNASSTQDGTVVVVIRADGDLENANNSYGAYSDEKLKENIVGAGSQWSDIKSLTVRKFNFKEDTGFSTHTQIGLIAQEVELVSPGLVTESPDRDAEGNDLGTTTKSVNYSVLYMKAVKALQEAMERIETLEAKVAALEGV
jgi:hypothetical protein